MLGPRFSTLSKRTTWKLPLCKAKVFNPALKTLGPRYPSTWWWLNTSALGWGVHQPGMSPSSSFSCHDVTVFPALWHSLLRQRWVDQTSAPLGFEAQPLTLSKHWTRFWLCVSFFLLHLGQCQPGWETESFAQMLHYKKSAFGFLVFLSAQRKSAQRKSSFQTLSHGPGVRRTRHWVQATFGWNLHHGEVEVRIQTLRRRNESNEPLWKIDWSSLWISFRLFRWAYMLGLALQALQRPHRSRKHRAKLGEGCRPCIETLQVWLSLLVHSMCMKILWMFPRTLKIIV